MGRKKLGFYQPKRSKF